MQEPPRPPGDTQYVICFLIPALGRKKCVLVGHDWGGAIGYSFCGKYPEMASQYIVCNLPHPSSLAEQWKSSPEQASCFRHFVFPFVLEETRHSQSSMFMFFLLRPPTKPSYCDITMHAQYFFSRGKGKTLRRECPTCDEKRGEGKGEMDHRPQDEKWTRKRNTP